ncbi:MAG: hypothetical protein H6559_10340 [Lewinellaceae bacterium]|nr:hypothetical protein [Lewinellaceae bacterium]
MNLTGARMVAFFSASPHQLSYEYVDTDGQQGYGMLSYAFSRAFATAFTGRYLPQPVRPDRLRRRATHTFARTPGEGLLDEQVLGARYSAPGISCP